MADDSVVTVRRYVYHNRLHGDYVISPWPDLHLSSGGSWYRGPYWSYPRDGDHLRRRDYLAIFGDDLALDVGGGPMTIEIRRIS